MKTHSAMAQATQDRLLRRKWREMLDFEDELAFHCEVAEERKKLGIA